MSVTTGVDYFIPVLYPNKPLCSKHKMAELCDRYFFLGGRVAIVISQQSVDGSEEIQFSTGEASYKYLKYGSYATVVIPIFMIIGKTIFRCTSQYHEYVHKIDKRGLKGHTPEKPQCDIYNLHKCTPLPLILEEDSENLKPFEAAANSPIRLNLVEN